MSALLPPVDMSPGNCTINYNIPYHYIMEYSPYFTVWFYVYLLFFVAEQGSNKYSHHHFAILHHQFWNLIHQLYVCIFYRPVAHLPMFGFQIGGITRSWGLNAIELWIFWVWIVFGGFCTFPLILWPPRVHLIDWVQELRAAVNSARTVVAKSVLFRLRDREFLWLDDVGIRYPLDHWKSQIIIRNWSFKAFFQKLTQRVSAIQSARKSFTGRTCKTQITFVQNGSNSDSSSGLLLHCSHVLRPALHDIQDDRAQQVQDPRATLHTCLRPLHLRLSRMRI